MACAVKLAREIDGQADEVSALGSMIGARIVMLQVLAHFVAETAGSDELDVLTTGIIAAVVRVSFED